VVGADLAEWDRMIAINVQRLLPTTHASLPHLLAAAENWPRRVADVVNISSLAGRVARSGSGSTTSPSSGSTASPSLAPGGHQTSRPGRGHRAGRRGHRARLS
jgi:NAD(P)-dependent dehydrogenase (short-subunit alcohol dehydrogenase family)